MAADHCLRDTSIIRAAVANETEDVLGQWKIHCA